MDLAACTLSEKITEKSLNRQEWFSEPEIIEMMQKLITALYLIAKEKQLMHRDIKPSNILLIDDQWCIADFGVSSFFKKKTMRAPEKINPSMKNQNFPLI